MSGPRVLTCIDPVPASDGSCAQQAWIEQPAGFPALSLEDGKAIGDGIVYACVAVLVIKLFFKPSTHRPR